MASPFSKTVVIDAPPAAVWDLLTRPERMKTWMFETPIDILTDWSVGSPMTISGDWYKSRFESKGVVLAFEPLRLLRYSQLSSLSRLPDVEENYTVIECRLEGRTELTVTVSGFPTEVIYKHLAFYWGVAVGLVKKEAER